MAVLEKHEDYTNWDKLAQHCDTLGEITAFEKEKAKNAFLTLKSEFGDDFLAKAFTIKHPICDYIINTAPWTRLRIIEFAGAIEELKNKNNYNELLARLKDGARFSEGFSVLNTACKFSKSGFDISFDPIVNIAGKNKKPDIKITDKNTNEELFVEVSILGEGQAAKEANKTWEGITWSLTMNMSTLLHCGRIYKVLSEKHLEETIKKLLEKIEKVKSTNTFQELIEDGVIAIGLAPRDGEQLLAKWAAERGFKTNEFIGPSFDDNEIARTRGKIRCEQKQLPDTVPNILVVIAPNLFFFVSDGKKLISELEEEVYKYPQILFTVIQGGHMGSGKGDIKMKDQHLSIEKTNSKIFTEKNILMVNRFCKLKVSGSTLSKIYQAVVNY